MELATLLELLYSARERSRTISATVYRRYDQAHELELLKERGLYREPPPIPPEEGSWANQPAAVQETTTRLWAAWPDRLRWETAFTKDGVEGMSVGVKDGELFWERIGDGEIHTNEGREPRGAMTTAVELLLDPSRLLGDYRFEIGAPTTWHKRRALEVTASSRPGARPGIFGPLSDQLALVVDEDRGVLLRAAVVVDGEELSSSEVVELVFDEPIPADLFRPLR
jgi:hypothetical protein